MRASKAYIAGLGTTTVLVGSTVLLFLVVSALVAFNGWPGSGISDAVSDLVVRDEQGSLTVGGPTQVALDAAPAAAAVGAATVPSPAGAGAVAAGDPVTGFAPGTPPVTPGPGGGDQQGSTGFGPGIQGPAEGGPSPQPVQPGTGSGPGGNPARGLSGVTKGLGDTTQGLTDGLGRTVGGVNPGLGRTVTDTGRALSDLVRGLGPK